VGAAISSIAVQIQLANPIALDQIEVEGQSRFRRRVELLTERLMGGMLEVCA
jgi:hypothetical protein